jgi:hypothetical protein
VSGIQFDTVLSIAIGIVVAAFFWWLSIRRSQNAIRERVTMANDDFIRTIERVFALQDMKLTRREVLRVKRRMARSYSIEFADIISSRRALENVYALIIENAYLGNDRKRTVLGAIEECIADVQERPTDDRPTGQKRSLSNELRFMTGILAVLFGALTSWFFEIASKRLIIDNSGMIGGMLSALFPLMVLVVLVATFFLLFWDRLIRRQLPEAPEPKGATENSSEQAGKSEEKSGGD